MALHTVPRNSLGSLAARLLLTAAAVSTVLATTPALAAGTNRELAGFDELVKDLELRRAPYEGAGPWTLRYTGSADPGKVRLELAPVAAFRVERRGAPGAFVVELADRAALRDGRNAARIKYAIRIEDDQGIGGGGRTRCDIRVKFLSTYDDAPLDLEAAAKGDGAALTVWTEPAAAAELLRFEGTDAVFARNPGDATRAVAKLRFRNPSGDYSEFTSQPLDHCAPSPAIAPASLPSKPAPAPAPSPQPEKPEPPTYSRFHMRDRTVTFQLVDTKGSGTGDGKTTDLACLAAQKNFREFYLDQSACYAYAKEHLEAVNGEDFVSSNDEELVRAGKIFPGTEFAVVRYSAVTPEWRTAKYGPCTGCFRVDGETSCDVEWGSIACTAKLEVWKVVRD